MLTPRLKSVHARKTPLPKYSRQADPKCAPPPNPTAECPIPYARMPPMTFTRARPVTTYQQNRRNSVPRPSRGPLTQPAWDAPPAYWTADHFRDGGAYLANRQPPIPAPPARAVLPRRRSGQQWADERIQTVLYTLVFRQYRPCVLLTHCRLATATPAGT